MPEQRTLMKSDLPLPLFICGKVRDTYELGDHLLIIATDRISTFDVVLPDGIPDKGKVLNQLSAFWFEKTKGLLSNHLVEVVNDTKALDSYLSAKSRFSYPAYLAGRSMIVKKAERIAIEWVIRGYLSGSAWEEYKKSGTISGMKMPPGLRESEELPEPLFTPTTKAETGHDEPITMDEVKKIIGAPLTEEMKAKSLAVYNYAREHARTRGIIIADTKMEFGLDNGKLILIDELLTPDSSRFWDAEKYRVGQSQPSYDKQPVRDWLVERGWNKEPPPPSLSSEVIRATTARYREAYRRLTGKELR
ncbi:MAG: phosphoribosylaminoimidazolesuccinocarboxamide synthase [Chloroflexi bacterium]|nr:phosphoribosylaminoimidazolesuccinocarboxamide synthase [Chloroflexota bacterium]